MKRLVFTLFLIFTFSVHANYKIGFYINIGSKPIGEIHITNQQKIVKTSIKIYPFFFVKFRQELLTVINDFDYTDYEFAKNFYNKKISSNATYFTPTKTRVFTFENNTIRSNIYCVDSPVTLINFISLFIIDKIDTNKVYNVFNYDHLYKVRIKKLNENEYFVDDEESIYEVIFKNTKVYNFSVPETVKIIKYRMFGINWNIFNLTRIYFES